MPFAVLIFMLILSNITGVLINATHLGQLCGNPRSRSGEERQEVEERTGGSSYLNTERKKKIFPTENPTFHKKKNIEKKTLNAKNLRALVYL